MNTHRVSFMLLTALLAACSPSAHMPGPRNPLDRIGVSTSDFPNLRQGIESLLPDSLFPPANIGIQVVSLTTGETLYSLNADLLFHPASNQKLFTAAAGLSTLGPDYQFVTAAFIDTSDTPRVIIRGGGDPLLSTNDLDTLAQSLAPLMQSHRGWILLADMSFFDSVSMGEGWVWDDEPDPTAMEISPLSVNRNSIRVSVTPGRLPGEPVLVSLDPATGFVRIRSNAVTVPAGSVDSLVVDRVWVDGMNVVAVNGTMQIGSPVRKERFGLRHPASYTLALLAEQLAARGISIAGTGVSGGEVNGAPAVWRAHTLDSVLVFMNKQTDNLCAENMLKVMGAMGGGNPGTAPKGTSAIRRFLAGIGIDTLEVSIADGSGVSRYNLTSASAIVTLLRHMHAASPWNSLFRASLPVAGIDGTLSGRMVAAPARGNVRAKTGTLRDASALSGYVTTADGEELAFSILIQHFATGLRHYRKVQDSVGEFLSRLHRSNF